MRDETEVDRCESLKITPLFTKQQIEHGNHDAPTAVLDAVFSVFPDGRRDSGEHHKGMGPLWLHRTYAYSTGTAQHRRSKERTTGASSGITTAEDRDMLESTCREMGAKVFVSTYYSFPSATPAALLLYDMIPEVFEEADAMWAEKLEASKCVFFAQHI